MHKVIEEITEANRWRDGEFAKFKINASGVDETFWYRMCIPMIYAHWEGYVVSSLKILIQYLNKLELHPKSVPTNLVVVSLGDKYGKLAGKQSFKQKVEFTDGFSIFYENKLEFTKKVDAKSNLKSDVLENICVMFGFQYQNFKEFTPDIDRLVNVRNSIAHGENSIIPSKSNLEKYIKSVSKATDILLQEINRFIEQKEYLLK